MSASVPYLVAARSTRSLTTPAAALSASLLNHLVDEDDEGDSSPRGGNLLPRKRRLVIKDFVVGETKTIELESDAELSPVIAPSSEAEEGTSLPMAVMGLGGQSMRVHDDL